MKPRKLVWMARIVLIFGMFVVAGILRQAVAAPQQDTKTVQLNPQELEKGKQTFERTCSTCHGLDGGGAMGPNIQGIPMRIAAPLVASTIKNGMSGGGPGVA